MDARKGILYPLMVIAAVSVIVFSFVGIAAMTGHLPAAQSQQKTDPGSGAAATPALTRSSVTRVAAQGNSCASCGVVESIRLSEVVGQATGLGAVAGGVAGGLLGNQVGNGNGRTAATLLGAAGGAFVGNSVEKEAKKTTRYVIRVRMEDGSYRTVYERAQPQVSVGERVRVSNGTLVASG